MISSKSAPLPQKRPKPASKKNLLELKKLNLKLHKQILKYQAEIVSLRNEIRAIKEDAKARNQQGQGGEIIFKVQSSRRTHKAPQID